MGKLHKIRVKSDAFIANYNVNIERSIMSVEDKLVKLNKRQMMSHKDAEGKPLVHRSTQSTRLTPRYAAFAGKSRPNLFLTGAFQKEMFLNVNENNLTWFIDSTNEKSSILVHNYGRIFGIKDKEKAKSLTWKAFASLYTKEVIKA